MGHIEIYDSYFGYDREDYKPCELFDIPGHDVHHIDARGMGGRKSADVIENLMRLNREIHDVVGDITKWKPTLRLAHSFFMKHRVPYIHVAPYDEIFDQFLLNPKFAPLIMVVANSGTSHSIISS